MKRTVMGLMAIVIAVASYAFVTNSKADKQRDTHWYQFVGDPTDVNDVLEETNYVYTSSPQGCNGSDWICAIEVPGDDSPNANPDDFDQSTKTQLQQAFNGGTPASFIEMKLAQ